MSDLTAPDVLGMLDDTKSILDNMSNKTRRVKIEKNESVMVRWFPILLGENRSKFYILQHIHWIGKRPFFCAQTTPVEFGGVAGYKCALCTMTQQMNDSADRVVSKAGFRSMANAQFITYVVLRAFTERGQWINMQGGDAWLSHEFSFTRPAFEKWVQIYRNNMRSAQSPWGILDPHTGNDFIVAADARAQLSFDKQNPGPLIGVDPSDPSWQATMDMIVGSVQLPQRRMLTQEDVDTCSEKLAELIKYLRRSGQNQRQGDSMDFGDLGGGGTAMGDIDGGEMNAAPTPRSVVPRAVAVPATPSAAMVAPSPMAPAPMAPRAPTPPAVARGPVPPSAGRVPPPPAANRAPAPAPAAPRPVAPPIAAAPVAAPIAAPQGRTEGQDLDENDNVTDENREFVDPAADITDITAPLEEPPPVVTPPPAVTPPAPRPTTAGVTSRLAAGIAQAQNRR